MVIGIQLQNVYNGHVFTFFRVFFALTKTVYLEMYGYCRTIHRLSKDHDSEVMYSIYIKVFVL